MANKHDNTKPYNDNSSATHIVANTADVSAASCADEYIIMSNDTGYDPAVRFWKDKGFAVRRFNVNFCKQAVQRRKNIKYQVVADIPSKEDNVNNNTNINTDTDAITAKSYNLLRFYLSCYQNRYEVSVRQWMVSHH